MDKNIERKYGKEMLPAQDRICTQADGNINQRWTRIKIPNGIRLVEIYLWAEEAFAGNYKLSTRYVFIEQGADATLFNLKWARN